MAPKSSARGLEEADYAGALALNRDQKGNNDILNLTRPDDRRRRFADSYIAAGADLLATNTFNANSDFSQADYGAETLVGEINRAAARHYPRACCDAGERRSTASGGSWAARSGRRTRRCRSRRASPIPATARSISIR